MQRLAELDAVQRFDIKIDPSTRKLVLAHPQSGTDLTASVFLDECNIDNTSVATSVAPDDLVSYVSTTGTSQATDGTNTALYSARSTAAVRSAYGRSWSGQNFNGVSMLSTLEDHGDAFFAARSKQLIQPGMTIIPRVGADIGDFHAGDTLSYSFDAGLGLQTATPWVAKLTVKVAASGEQRLILELA